MEVSGAPVNRLVVAPSEIEVAPLVDPCDGPVITAPGATTTGTTPPTAVTPGRVFAIDGTTGQELWSVDLPFGVGSGHVVGSTLLLLQARQWPDGLWPNIIAVDPTDGSFRWQLFLDTLHPAWEEGGRVVDGPEMVYQLGSGPSADVAPSTIQDIAVTEQGEVRFVDVRHEMPERQDAIQYHHLEGFDIPLDDDHPWVDSAERSDHYTLVHVDGHTSNRVAVYEAGATKPLWVRDDLTHSHLMDDRVILTESLPQPAAGQNTGFGTPYGPGRISMVSAADPDQVAWTVPLRFNETLYDGYLGHHSDTPVFATRDDLGNFDLVAIDDPAALPAIVEADSGLGYDDVDQRVERGEALFDDRLLIAASSTAPTGTGQPQLGIRRNEPGAPITVLPLAGGSLFVHRFGDRVVIVDGGGFTC